jgi:WD40 repeat protein
MTSQGHDLPQQSPFVGVRSFDESTRSFFFGRDREARDLLNLLIAQRTVLLHAPSGAGKTSLIQAALVPDLRLRKFEVAPIIRLGLKEAKAGRRLDANRYLNSTLRSLSGPSPSPTPQDDTETDSNFPTRLARLLAERPWITDEAKRREEAPAEHVLIFDQFEEILSADPIDLDAKTAFFEQVGLALRDPGLWALFAMREDYIGALEPYLPLIPNRLSATLRLDLLGREAAGDAIRRPAEKLSVTVDNDVVASLIRDLARIQVMDPLDGQVEWKDGPYVEPLHLQVVCESLWRVRAASDRITADDFQRLADELGEELHGVTAALACYYDTSIRETAEQFRNDGVTERSIRNWFDRALISASGLRLPVLLGIEKDFGLNPDVLKGLADRYLVRPDQRYGGIYYELAHDRLVEPVRKSNAQWRDQHLAVLPRRAERWAESRLDSDLLRGKELEQAESWAKAPVEPLSVLEKDFLKRSLDVRDADRKAARSQQLRATIVWLSVVLFVALILSGFAVAQWHRALRLTALMTMQQGLAYCEQGNVDYGMLYLVRSLEQTPWLATDLRRVIPTQLSCWRSQLHTLQDRVELGKPIWAVAFSPDGRRSITSSNDGKAQLWDAVTGKHVGEHLQHLGSVRAMAFSPDGKTVLTGSDDNTAQLWDGADGRQTGKPLRGHDAPLTVVAFSPDGQKCLTSSSDEKAELWNAITGEPRGGHLRDPGFVAMALSSDGKTVLMGNDNGTARLWDADSGRLICTLSGHERRVKAAVFSIDGKTVMTGADDDTARLWDAVSGRQIGNPLRHQGGVTSVAFGPDGDTIITGSYFGTAQLWDRIAGRPIGPPMRHGGPVWAVAISSDGRSVLTGSEDGAVRLWHVAIPPPSRPPLRYDGRVKSVAFSPDGRTIATGSAEGTACLWDADSGAQILLAGHEKPVKAVAFSSDGKFVVTGSDDGSARLWDAASGRPIGDPLRHQTGITAVALSHDDKFVVTGSYDSPTKGTAQLWDAKSGHPISRPLGHSGPVWAVAFSPDDKSVMTGSGDGTAQLWDVASGLPNGEPLRHRGPVWAVAFSPDGKILVTGSQDRTARLWDTTSRRPFGEALRHRGPVRALAFAPEGQILVTGSDDATARLWDVYSDQPLGPPLVHNKAIHAIACGPRGTWVCTASDDTASRWERPAPLRDKPYKIGVWMRVVTGLELGEWGGIDALDDQDWRRYRDELLRLGGAPP